MVKRVVGWLSALLKHPRLVVEIGIVSLVLLVWFGGRWIGLDSEGSRFQVIFLILLARAATHILSYLLAQRRAAKLEASLRQQAQSR